MKIFTSTFFALVLTLPVMGAGFARGGEGFGEPYPLEVFPTQAKHTIDDVTGVELTFLTDGTISSTALYFHERSWISDGSAIVFYAQAPLKGGMAFLTGTEELVRLVGSDGNPLGQMTCAIKNRSVFGIAGGRVLEILLDVTPAVDPVSERSVVMAREREIVTLPFGSWSLNESCDGKYLALGGPDMEIEGKTAVYLIDLETGAFRRLCGMPEGTTLSVSHIQWSITNPNLLSFANGPQRIWIVDIRSGVPFAPYKEWPGELVTHEMWWVNDQILFCGGTHPKPQEDGHVKLLNPHTGEVRIVGAGAWWADSTAAELAKYNFWHPCGSADGRWIVADNWHGMLVVFEGKTTRARLLTQGHRTYGEGTHPEPSWDPWGREVIFSSLFLGGVPNVCIATLPEEWHRALDEIGP